MNRAAKEPLQHAGWCLLEAAILQAKGRLNTAKYYSLLASARHFLVLATPKENYLLFTATKTALEAVEACERGEDLLNGMPLFKSLVENLHGGPRDFDFGGRPRQGPKPSADQAFGRAAAVALWKHFPKNREELVADARKEIGIGSRKKLQKLVDNYEQRHDTDISRSRSPLSVHMSLVEEFITDHNYRRLSDFLS